MRCRARALPTSCRRRDKSGNSRNRRCFCDSKNSDNCEKSSEILGWACPDTKFHSCFPLLSRVSEMWALCFTSDRRSASLYRCAHRAFNPLFFNHLHKTHFILVYSLMHSSCSSNRGIKQSFDLGDLEQMCLFMGFLWLKI